MPRRALISDDGLYRYTLVRQWGRWGAGRRVLWIMLNPSRADARIDDPTIRRCTGFSRGWGFGAMEVVNLFALRTSEPDVLRRHADPVGPDNDRHIARAVRRADVIVAAWGACGTARDRAREVLSGWRCPLMCLGTTSAGFPRHPLYVRADAALRPFSTEPPAEAGGAAFTDMPGARHPRLPSGARNR